jgi:hypothetical protein
MECLRSITLFEEILSANSLVTPKTAYMLNLEKIRDNPSTGLELLKPTVG